MILWAMMFACSATSNVPDRALPPPANPLAVVKRAAVQLQGRLPTNAELDRVEQGELDAVLEELLNAPDVGLHYADLVATLWRTRIDAVAPLEPFGSAQRSMGDEPLRILANIVDADLPYTELVTGDWTMANEQTAEVWPVQRDRDGEGWTRARYTDARPAAGVLASNGLWWRYGTTKTNANRGRANALTRILLCVDFASRPVNLDRSQAVPDTESLQSQASSNPACSNCHAALDPIASNLFGFGFSTEQRKYSRYEHGSELVWRLVTGTPPGYFGQPANSLTELGYRIAADPRFVSCAVQTTYEAYLRRDASLDDLHALVKHREAFIRGDLTIRALLRSMFRDASWRAAGDPTHPDAAQLMTPTTYARVVQSLTGWSWTWEGVGMLENDTYGLRVVGGGSDGVTIFDDSRLPTPTMFLTYQFHAQAAASWAVEHDADRPPGLRLWPEGVQAPSTASVDALHRRVFGRLPTSDERDAAMTLVETLSGLGAGVTDVWATLLATWLTDDEFVTY